MCCSVGPPLAVWPSALPPRMPVSTLTLFCEVLRIIHNEKKRNRTRKRKKKNCVCCSVGPPSAVWP